MNVWVITRKEDKSIQSINSYDKTVEEIKQRISELSEKYPDRYELIEDERIIEIFNFFNRFEDKKVYGDDQKRIEKLENAIEDIEDIIRRID